MEQGYDEEYSREIDELEALDVYKSSQEVAEIYQREIRWLKARNVKVTNAYSVLQQKHKEFKATMKANDVAWDKLKSENDNLLEIIQELEAECTHQKTSHAKIRSSVEKEIQDVGEQFKKAKIGVKDIDAMISKINELVDTESESSTSRDSDQYKNEIRNLNLIIDKLVTKLQSPSKQEEPHEESKSAHE